MSILIKGAKMPKDCFECPLYNLDHVCVILNRQNLAFDKPIDCPLVEILPHGRLIDASEMAIKFNCRDIDITTVKKLHELLMEIPTVIESEEE